MFIDIEAIFERL